MIANFERRRKVSPSHLDSPALSEVIKPATLHLHLPRPIPLPSPLSVSLSSLVPCLFPFHQNTQIESHQLQFQVIE